MMIRGASQLPSFNDAVPLGPGDEEFVNDIREVLAKHGNLSRFGLCLLHDHFPIHEGEILLETHDTAARTLALRTVKAEELAGLEAKMTSWHFANMTGEPVSPGDPVAMTGCDEDKCK